MTKISIHGSVTKVTAKRIGSDSVINKKLKIATVAETHVGPANRRVTGKQKSPELTSFSASELRAITAADLAAKEITRKEAEDTLNRQNMAISKVAQKHADDIQKKANAKEKALKNKIERMEQKPMKAETKKNMMAGSLQSEPNTEATKISGDYDAIAKKRRKPNTNVNTSLK